MVIYSGFHGSTRPKHVGKKDSLTKVPLPDLNFKSMSDNRSSSIATAQSMSSEMEGDDVYLGTTEDDLLISSVHSTFKLCQRSQVRRNTDFSQASQDLKKFLAERETKRRDSDQELLDILPPPSYKYV